MSETNLTHLISARLLGQISEVLEVKADRISMISRNRNLGGLDKKGLDNQVLFKLDLDNEMIAQFSLAPFPGCCGLCISTGAYVVPHMRRKGLGTLLNLLRIHLATEFGYGLLIATSKETNVPQSNIFFANNWEAVQQFINPRTGNHLVVHTYLLEGGK